MVVTTIAPSKRWRLSSPLDSLSLSNSWARLSGQAGQRSPDLLPYSIASHSRPTVNARTQPINQRSSLPPSRPDGNDRSR